MSFGFGYKVTSRDRSIAVAKAFELISQNLYHLGLRLPDDLITHLPDTSSFPSHKTHNNPSPQNSRHTTVKHKHPKHAHPPPPLLLHPLPFPRPPSSSPTTALAPPSQISNSVPLSSTPVLGAHAQNATFMYRSHRRGFHSALPPPQPSPPSPPRSL